jgi:hypothetical protein
MSEQLHFNILNFEWPENNPTFYFSLNESQDSYRIYKYSWSPQIIEAFPELEETQQDFIYTTFTAKTEDSLEIELDKGWKNLKIYRQYLKQKISDFFISKGFIATRNFIRDLQIWLPKKDGKHEFYTSYYKFSIKIQFKEVTEYPELIISYDGIAKIMNIPISEIDHTTMVKRTVFKGRIFNYQKINEPEKEDFYNSIDFEKAYPLLRSDLAKVYDIKSEKPERGNRYRKYVDLINKFKDDYLLKDDFKEVVKIRDQHFIKVEEKLIDHINPKKGELEFGGQNKGLVPKIDLGRYKPYQRPKNKPNIQFFFIHHKDHQEKIKTFHKYLKNGTGDGTFFKGIEKYTNLPLKIAKNHFIEYKDINDPLPEIKTKLGSLEFDENVTYAAFYMSPFDKYTPKKEDRLVYIKVKELLLNEGIVTQAIDFEKMQKDITNPKNFQYTLNNISLALFAKLGGKPWKLSGTGEQELVIGVGAYTFQDEQRRYIASAFSFQNNGFFRGFEYFSENSSKELAGSICNKIREFSSLVDPSKVVIHFYKDMSKREIKPIREGMNRLGLKVPLYILNINKTESQDLMAFDNGWENLMPKSGTYIRIGEGRFLLFNNVRYNNDIKSSKAEGYPFPIKISISSPDKGAFEEVDIYKNLLTQVYQFSRLYWKSLRQQNVPITIKYPEMLAQIAPLFDNPIPDHAKDKLWFL